MESIMKRFRLDGKKAFVTGAAGGIGKATAAALAGAGADVAIVDLESKKENLQRISKDIAATYGVRSISVAADVSDPEQVDAMINTIIASFGTVDVVHSNAGIISGPEVDVDTSYDDWKRVMEINLNGMFLVGRAAAQVMMRDQKGGSIINTASMSGLIVNEIHGRTGGSSYPASKGGVIQLTRAQAAQWARFKIRVNSISPGVVLSGIHDGLPREVMDFQLSRIPLGRFGTVEDMQGLVVYLASEASAFMTGSNLVIDGGYTVF